VPLLNLRDTHVTAPWFGPNVWTALLRPVSGGGIPAEHAAIELKITFKDGGAFDFHTSYERIRERLAQAVDVARESGQVLGDGSERAAGRGGDALGGVNMDSVHLDQLPRYEDVSGRTPSAATASTSPQRDSGVAVSSPLQSGPSSPPPSQQTFTPPAEPPPGYEEVQMNSVASDLEERLREAEDS
jgi:WW domain-binding protein 2